MNVSDRDLETYGESFLQSFEAIRRALQLYPGTHPKVAEQLDRFVTNLAAVHRDLEQATFNVVEKEFFINGLPLKRLSLAYAKPLATWEALGLGLVRFQPGTSREDALKLFEILGMGLEEIVAAGGVPALLARAGIDTIRVTGIAVELTGSLLSVFDSSSLSAAEASRSDVARSRYKDSRAVLGSLVESARGSAGSPARVLRTTATLLERRLTEREPVAELLAQLREHHEPSWRHALDGAAVAVLLGRALGLGRERLALLGEAAALRDVGKTEVALEALDSPEADEASRAEHRRHPVAGARLLARITQIDPSAAIVALEHHVGFDRRGFPALRPGRGLHPFARVVAVASAYDELAGEAAGEARLLPAEAVKRIVQAAGSAHDPAAVRALLAVVGLYPEGTAVKLRDGRQGIVVGPGERQWGQPDVAVLRDAAGREVEPVVVVRTSEGAGPGEPAVTAAGAPTREDAERVRAIR